MPVARSRSMRAQSAGAEHAVSRPVSLSTQRNAGMSSFEPSRIPAWLAPVCEERSVSHSVSPCVPSATQRAMCRRVPVPHRPPEHGQREPVDLEVDDPGHVGRVAAALPARDALHDAQRVRVVVVRPEDHLEHDAHGGDDERREERPAEVVDREGVLEHVRGELQHEGVERQDEQEAEREHERQPQRREQRRQDRVQHGDDRGHRERAAGALDVDAGQDRRRHPERRAPSAPTTAAARSGLNRGRSGCQATVSPYAAVGSPSFASFAARFSAFFAARCAFCSATLTFAST